MKLASEHGFCVNGALRLLAIGLAVAAGTSVAGAGGVAEQRGSAPSDAIILTPLPDASAPSEPPASESPRERAPAAAAGERLPSTAPRGWSQETIPGEASPAKVPSERLPAAASSERSSQTAPRVNPSDLERIIEAAPDSSPTPVEAPQPARSEPQSAPVPSFRGSPLAPKISWRLTNPFRFFNDPAATEVHRAAFELLRGQDRRNPVLAAEHALAAKHKFGWAAGALSAACWNDSLNKHQCKHQPDYLKPRKHNVIVSLEGVADAAAVECQWSIVPRGDGAIAPESAVQPCDTPVLIQVPYPNGSDVSVSLGGAELDRASIVVRDLLIVGMGDSFASGEGNPDLPVRFSRERDTVYGDSSKEETIGGFPAREGAWKQIGDKAFISGNARWLDQACHRSLYSHQLRAALQLAIEQPQRAITYVGLACSGAEITDGLFLRYKGNEWVPNPPAFSQISAAAHAQCDKAAAEPQDLPEAYRIGGAVPELGGLVLHKCPAEHARKIDLVFLSIGGNDIGFARLLANAILADQSTLRKLGGWFGQVHGQTQAAEQIEALDERYKALNRALHNILHIPWNESDRILLTGYPGLALLGDGREVCPDGTAGMEIVSDFKLSAVKAREGVWISDKLNRIMKDSADRNGWTFVDQHRAAFVDRGICAGFTDNAFSIADDLRLPRMKDGKWYPYNPADFPPYAPRQRWFRTPNDAFMTGNFHVAPSLLQKALKLKSLSFFQLILSATYSGAFHPTAEGHAAIADALVERSRAVLERHGQGGSSAADRAQAAR